VADEGFLKRWSRRKVEARSSPTEPEPAREMERGEVSEATAPRDAAASTEARVPDAADAAIDLEALPDIDTMTYESDFTPFMRKGVPPELRRRALQRLWRSNPTLANLDGLVDYGEDYTRIGTTKQVVRTAYQVGRGMLERIAPKAPSEPAPAGDRTTADGSQPDTTSHPTAPGPAPGAAGGAGEAVTAAAVRPEGAPRPGRGTEE
jgi:Protein of unknown function (DUF3306)